MEEEDKLIVKWAQEDVETSNNLLNYYYYYYYYCYMIQMLTQKKLKN